VGWGRSRRQARAPSEGSEGGGGVGVEGVKGGGERFGFGRGRLEPRAAGCTREDAGVEELHVSYVGGARSTLVGCR
jgi:hypothetical protein